MKEQKLHDQLQDVPGAPLQRKSFLKYTAISGAAMFIGLESCKKDNKNPNPSPSTTDVGSGDTGILNFAYALEQLEAAFYTMVSASFYAGITTDEQTILTDIMYHEVLHRNFFKAALGTSAIGTLQFDFSSVDFTSRASVLNTAKALEETGVSAYNGAGAYITNPDYLTLAGKIVSVEARHAAAIRDLLNPKSGDFAGDDVVNPASGLDFSRTPNSTTGGPSIVATANRFLTTKISATKLP
ncbi:MAG: ferritin-like domain-containing protein [Bacteroidota bacterium]|nr:ferritin-like domain-containing protein [Bacteroidota bacterium]MDP4212334.1 ferritin-like domain-containing protein [Bacteroidota bacterium]MDP4249694.1 ferritin-like domain-containing protein [Bacteroidota bacterium]